MSDTTKTIYQIAMEEMNRSIAIYLSLAETTNGLTNVTINSLEDDETRRLFLAGFGVANRDLSPQETCEEWKRRQALFVNLHRDTLLYMLKIKCSRPSTGKVITQNS